MKLSTERVREHRAHAESQGASATTFQPGQPFNPHGLFYGVFVPEALVRCKDLSPGAKLAYGRLVRYAGQDGACHPRQETLAVELGVSGRQVRTYLGELSRHRFLRAVRKGLHAPNDYIFLWHTIFDGTDRSGSSCRDRKDTSCQDRKGTSTQDRQRVSAPERKKTSIPISRESGQESQVPPADTPLAGVSSSSAEKHLYSSLAPLATGKTSQNHIDAERAARAPATLAAATDDDDKKTSKQRAPGETPRKEFLLRVAERHPKLDATALLALVEKDLRKTRISMSAILAYDTEHTTNHAAIANPPGYYRWLVQSVVSEQAEALKTGIPAGSYVVETPRCPDCKGGYRATGEYCTCLLGRDLATLERCKAEKAAKTAIFYPGSVDAGHGSASLQLLPLCDVNPAKIRPGSNAEGAR